MTYYYCLVPECHNTTVTAPGKIFFHVPNEPVRRKRWITAMRRDHKRNAPISDKSCLYVCEDHFDIENDMENFIRYKLQRVRPIMKKHVLPHRFDCQKKVVNPPAFPTKRKTRAAAAAKSSEPNFEPPVVIKEEPIDIDEDPVPSTSRSDQESILPCTDSLQPCSTPTVADVFTLVKAQPVELIVSNGNTTKSNKKATAEKAVEQSLPAEEDSATTENRIAKDHYDAYGEYIAGKLRSLDSKSSAYVQKAIAAILFDAELGKFK